ncbi:uncharacterized protein LOC133199940 [Saccostrea echinata]|uniref:uncharacterized protein LOC133199940 n=1 Tax=Saccostrea echinata TaxID=191078 RepID=UPI002A82B790|nr:uncharacterized protein LOC133199940 [Saccostrea echinata]
MPEDTIAIIPNMGNQPARQYSAKACRWLSWMSHQSGSHIRHARNGGEVKIGSYTVDGYQEATRTIYEFYGCYWHGCPTCYPNLQTETHPHRTQFTYQELHEETLRRNTVLEEMGYSVHSIWEHDFDQQVQIEGALQNYVRDLDIPDPLNPREALYGGRTNATRLYCEEGDMRYVDVCSLYPYVLKHRPFPLDHPQIITDDFQDVRTYFGLIHCRVLPPRGLYHPVLPYRTGGKLLFPLCRTCAERQDSTSKHRCQHTDQERSLTGTWVTTELHKALDMGYTLERIYEVWHFPESSQDLFRSYIDTFLKIKQEASGFPPDCQTEEQKLDYIRKVIDREGIRMDLLSIEKNPVRRTIAKLFLNCLWGKFAQRLLLPKTRYLTEEEEVQQLLQDSTIDIKGLELLENKEDPELDMMLVNYQEKQEFVEECPFGNVVLACFTTAHARLHLYETLQPLGDRVLYFDTDSIIYQHKEGQFNPTLGHSLGEWTDELDGDHIIKFMSGGPKNYAYLTAKGNSVCKVKGLTLNYRASNIVSPETLEKMLKKEMDEIQVSEPEGVPHYPNYALLLKREATFKEGWPESLKGLLPNLAKAGFYYRGVGDKTTCFHCGMGFTNWEPTDDPYVEHAYWNPNCPYINTYKGREWVMIVFINHLLRVGYKVSPEIKPLLDQTSTEIQATGKCHICLEGELQMALLPCGHVCCCSLCAPTFRYCPICRSDVKRTQRIFLC